jgi:hypothetical protein
MLPVFREPTQVNPSAEKPWTGALGGGGSNWWGRLADATRRAVAQSLAVAVMPLAR